MGFVVLLGEKIDNKENEYIKCKVCWKKVFAMENKAPQRGMGEECRVNGEGLAEVTNPED